jgi:2-amino-4-hydroxy-6-hydroxymethyldihydropteridine diphosphokinase
MLYYIGLGSNLGRRETNLQDALKELTNAGLRVCARSSLYCSEPVGPREQPWFVNQVVAVESPLEPPALLFLLQSVEKSLGRRKTTPKGPRLIDLDILLAGDLVLETENLVIPHREMHRRRFVLLPLVEIGSHVRHPIHKKSAVELLSECGDEAQVRLLKETRQCQD